MPMTLVTLALAWPLCETRYVLRYLAITLTQQQHTASTASIYLYKGSVLLQSYSSVSARLQVGPPCKASFPRTDEQKLYSQHTTYRYHTPVEF